MKYKFKNPTKENHTLNVDAANDNEAIDLFVKMAPTVGFYPNEVKQLVNEILNGEYQHVAVLQA